MDALAQLTFAVQGALGRIAAAHDVSMVQTRLLGILRDRHPTMKELAGLLELDKSSVSGLVDRAQDRGLVQRTASALDGRRVQVSITPAGRQLIEQARAAFEDEIEVLVGDLSPAQRTRLCGIASLIAVADAKRRCIDILDVEPAPDGGSAVALPF